MKRLILYLFLTTATVVLVTGLATAQKIQRSVIGSGGSLNQATSANWHVSGLAAQLAIEKRTGQVTDKNGSVYQGFWVPVEFNYTDVRETPDIVRNTNLTNYPNPASNYTNISYILPGQAYVSLKVYDVAGNLVKQLFDGLQDQGQNQVPWDLKNTAGITMSSGTYLYELNVAPASTIGSQAFSSYTAKSFLVVVK